MEVVAQESERRAGQRPRHGRVQPRALERKRDPEKQRRDSANARRDAIHVVQQVERVGQRHEPEHGG